MVDLQTYDAILKRMLGRVPTGLDKREGSVIYDALAPAAAELAQMYMELDIHTNLSFADTASGEYLERRTMEHGVSRQPATKARRKGLFYGNGGVPLDVPIGSRFSIGELNYIVVDRLGSGQFAMDCETPGSGGNRQFGTMLPIDYIDGLVRAELADVLLPGEDEEDDESLRQRFMSAINEQPFGGNISDYSVRINRIPGVGGVKIFPVWQGGGTVKCTVIASNYDPPAKALIDEVQAIVDPADHSGEGLGTAPIGHQVTIAGAKGANLRVDTTVVLAAGMTAGQVQSEIEAVIAAYFLELRKEWAKQTRLTVRISQIDARILTVPGVEDVRDTQLDMVADNMTLDEEEIPLLAGVGVHE